MSDEPLYEQIKRDTGIDPDQIAFDGIARANPVAEPEELTYPDGMDTSAENLADTEKLENTEEVQEEARVLTKFDRCDGCGAEAKGWAENEDGEFLFCNHHLDKHTERLTDLGYTVTVPEPVLV